MPKRSPVFVALMLAGASAAAPAAVYVDLAIPNARDHAFARDVLYVTAGSLLHRYDLSTCQWQAPVALGRDLAGIDVSRSGRRLAIADRDVVDGKVHIYIIDLDSDAGPVEVSYPAAFGEAGSYMVAWTANDYLTVSGAYAGSGWVPLRQLDLYTGTVTQARNVRQDTMLATSGDGELVALAESNSSAGPVALWNPVAAAPVATANTGRYVFEIAADDYGARVVVPTYFGAHVYANANGALLPDGVIGKTATWGPVSVVVPPGGTQFITADWDWNGANAGVKIYDAQTLKLQKRIDAYPFAWSGNRALQQGRLTLSADTRWLAANIAGGVRLYDLEHEPVDRLGETSPLASCGALHKSSATPAPFDTRTFDADGWELGARPDEAIDVRRGGILPK